MGFLCNKQKTVSISSGTKQRWKTGMGLHGDQGAQKQTEVLGALGDKQQQSTVVREGKRRLLSSYEMERQINTG